jgi:multidrug resistance protein, MATE family
MDYPLFRTHFRKNFSLAYPVMLSHFGQMMVGVADSVMVGRIGAVPLAAASLGNSVFVIFLVFGIGISFAITPLTAQSDGGGNRAKIREILRHGALVSFITGLVLFAVMYSGRNLILYMNQPEDVAALAIPYFTVIGASIIPFMIFQAFRQWAEGLGYTRQAMVITVAANLVNIGLNYVLIYGKLGFAPMGLFGAGLATLISRVFMAVLMLGFVLGDRRFTVYRPMLSALRLEFPMLRRLLSLGFPMALQLIFEVTSFSIAAIMVGWLGATQLAAHQIAINLASITYMVALGISTAATIRVGNHLGRKEYRSMRELVFTAYLMALAFMSITGLLFIFGRNFLPLMYIEDVSVHGTAAVLLIVAGLFQLSDGAQVVGLGALRGMSDVRTPTLITLVAYWLLGLPVGYVLGFPLGMGALGIWIGLLGGLTAAAVLLFRRFDALTRKLLDEQGAEIKTAADPAS